MSTLDVRSTAADDTVISNSATTWANGRDGVTFKTVPGGTGSIVGAALAGGFYSSNEMFISFDTSSIPDGATITNVVLTLEVSSEAVDSVSQTLEARIYDWGASVATADFRTGSQLSALTRVATCAIGAAPSGTLTFSEDGSNFINNINKTGTTYLVICSARAVGSGTAPTNSETVTFKNGEDATSTNRPRLQITYTTATTATADVTSSAAINSVIQSDVTTTGAIARTLTGDVTSTASVTAPVTTELTTDAAIEMTIASDVTSGAAISIDHTTDVTSTAAIGATGVGDVTSLASVSLTGTFLDVFTDASLGQVGRETVLSDASIGVEASTDVSSTASIGAGQYTPNSAAGNLQRGTGQIIPLGRGSGRISTPRRGVGG